MRKKTPISSEGLAMLLSLAAQQFPLVCPVCHQAVQDIRLRGFWFVRVPCGHRVQTAPTDERGVHPDKQRITPTLPD